MLTIEEIKKAVEFADGFIVSQTVIKFEDCFYYSLEEFNAERGLSTGFYDLFLDRVIQGMNRKLKPEGTGDEIIQATGAIIIYFAYHQEKSYSHDWTTEGIREAREKAIRSKLKEVV